MSASDPQRRVRALVLALGLGVCGASTVPRDAAAQDIVRLSGSLTFATVLPGQVPVVVVPWQSGLTGIRAPMARAAPVFQIVGTPNAIVKVRFPQLPSTIENGNGAGVVTITNYTAQYNTVRSPAGAVSFTPSNSWYAVTLDGSGKGYLSVGATVSLSASQPKGAYAWGEGGQVEVSY